MQPEEESAPAAQTPASPELRRSRRTHKQPQWMVDYVPL